MAGYTVFQSQYLAHLLTLDGDSADKLSRSIAAAKIDLNPHQVDAAMFALRSPLSKGVILADEVGLGKTIEAALVIAQRWAEKRRRILLIVPASLRKQWEQELTGKFSLPCEIIETKNYNQSKKAGRLNPFDSDKIIISSYEFASLRCANDSWNNDSKPKKMNTKRFTTSASNS
ncbi:MAG: SNF2-related protein [Acidobacteriota bacterium]|nr:SNF2-related protein [Acidobacteriota bacterium]